METTGGDFRTPSQVQFDALVDQINQNTANLDRLTKLTEKLLDGERGTTQTVVHKSGMGSWGAAAVTACFFTMLALIMLMVYIVPELHDLKAWQDIMRAKISRLEAKP